MFGEKVAFSQIATVDPDAAWKMLERCVSKGETEKLASFLATVDSDSPIWGPSAMPHKKSLVNRLIKSGDTGTLSKIFLRSPEKDSFAEKLSKEFFGPICESRAEGVVGFFFPEGKTHQFSHKQWETALLKKNMALLETMSLNIDPRRAMAFVENYFFDLQLAQLKYLDGQMENHQWPMKFVRDAISRQKGPGMVSFFIDRVSKTDVISPSDTWDAIAACMRTGNKKAMTGLVSIIQDRQEQGKAFFDWNQEGLPGDFNARGFDEVKIQANRLPPEHRAMTLIEFAVFRGDIDIAQDLVDCSAKTPDADRIASWKETLIKTMKAAGAKQDMANRAWIAIEGDFSLLKMQESACRPSGPKMK